MPRAKPTYATESDLRDIYPNIDKYDTKKPIYGWENPSTNFYKSYNTGLINVLFFDGIEGTAVTDDPNDNYEYSIGGESYESYPPTVGKTSSGTSAATETRPRNLALLACIKY